jgi:hypothetical protein
MQRATGVGIVSGLSALLLAVALDRLPDNALYLYAVLLGITALCGASVLWITVFDMKARGTSGRMRPIRVFDIALGALLLLPAGYALWRIWARLGL